MNRLEIQNVTQGEAFPEPSQFQQWVDLALAGQTTDHEIVIRLVDESESAGLNEQYRQKQGATNILSFPFEKPVGIELDLLGDLVICVPVVNTEAAQQNKRLFDHWAHITIHGVLHLLGYDHSEDDDAEQMESLEIQLLHSLHIANPYQEDTPS